jgi:hypothetical protein
LSACVKPSLPLRSLRPLREAKLVVKLALMKPIKIVSDGQTGADRAALDWALQHNVECGGWCPKGRKADDGPIETEYPLKETPSAAYTQRIEWSVRDSDATVCFRLRRS